MRCTERFPNTYFVPQFIDDLRLMYLGIPHPDTADSRVLHPTNLDHPVFVEDKARFFINLPSMFAFNREMDFNYGTRIHGAIGNILCAAPEPMSSHGRPRISEPGRVSQHSCHSRLCRHTGHGSGSAV